MKMLLQTYSRAELDAAGPLPAEWADTIPEGWRTHRPDWHGRILDGERIAAACSVWWHEAPTRDGQAIATIGHFGASTTEAGRAVLRAALAVAGANGAHRAVGPMDGNTWRRYRWMDAATVAARPPFLFEPTNPAQYPEIWTAEGFSPCVRYQSAVARDLKVGDPRFAPAVDLPEGIVVRSLDPTRFEADLRMMHEVSLASFRENLYYTPLDWESFRAMYAPVRERLVPEFVLLAFTGEGRPVGFAFGVPDLAEAARVGRTRTLIFKTVAVVPEWRGQGPGKWFFQEMHRRAAAAGFTEVIHALSAQSNHVVHLTARYAEVFRTYTLYERGLPAI